MDECRLFTFFEKETCSCDARVRDWKNVVGDHRVIGTLRATADGAVSNICLG